MAADVLVRLSALTGDGQYEQLAEGILTGMSGTMTQYPLAFGHLLSVLNFCLSPPEEIAIVGHPAADDSRDLLEVVYGQYRPSKVVAVGQPGDNGEATVPLLARRGMLERRATAYVCRRFSCRQPVTTPGELEAQLRTHRED